MDEPDVKIRSSAETQLETMVQIMAVLLDKLGGEVVISRRDFEMYEDVPVVGHRISPDYVVFRLGDEDQARDGADAEAAPTDAP